MFDQYTHILKVMWFKSPWKKSLFYIEVLQWVPLNLTEAKSRVDFLYGVFSHDKVAFILPFNIFLFEYLLIDFGFQSYNICSIF